MYLGKRETIEKIGYFDELKKYTSNNLKHDIYLQNFTNEIIKDLSNIYIIDLSRKYLTLSEIKKKFKFLKKKF